MDINYKIRYTKAAEKFFQKHEDVREQYKQELEKLLSGESGVDVKRIQGKRNNYFRIRVGQWRVIYTIINGEIVIIDTILAGSRGDVYKKMMGIK